MGGLCQTQPKFSHQEAPAIAAPPRAYARETFADVVNEIGQWRIEDEMVRSEVQMKLVDVNLKIDKAEENADQLHDQLAMAVREFTSWIDTIQFNLNPDLRSCASIAQPGVAGPPRARVGSKPCQ